MSHDHRDMLARADATDRMVQLRESILADHETERIAIEAGISGRVLAEELAAPDDVPAHDHATMDGFAFDATEDYPLSVPDTEVFPEDEPPSMAAGEAIPIATGASLPERANAVLKVEEATVESGELRGSTIEPGTYTYERGSNVTAGETLFERGERLSAKDAALLRDLGVDDLASFNRFSAGLLATGSEIHEGRTADLDSPMLADLVRSWGHEATIAGTVPDEYDRTERAVADLADRHDVVITTGGTSVGEKDYVIRALESLGDVLFHRVRVRPGKPIAAARLPAYDAVAFAIPGKPVGAHTIATLVMRPFFVGANDPLPTVAATLSRDVAIGASGFEYAVPVTLSDGRAMPLGHVDSPLSVYEETFDPSVLSSSTRATRADGVVITDTDLSAEDTVRVLPYPVVE